MNRQFTTNDVIRLTGITARQLQWWDERGLVTPARQGHRRIYNWDQLVTAAVICQLRRRGFPLQRVRKVVAFLGREFGTNLAATVRAASEYHLLTDGTHLYLRTSSRQVVDLLKNSSQPMFDICLSDEVRRVQAEIRRGPIRPGHERPRATSSHEADSNKIDPNKIGPNKIGSKKTGPNNIRLKADPNKKNAVSEPVHTLRQTRKA